MGQKEGIKNAVFSVDIACLHALAQYIIIIMHTECVLH